MSEVHDLLELPQSRSGSGTVSINGGEGTDTVEFNGDYIAR